MLYKLTEISSSLLLSLSSFTKFGTGSWDAPLKSAAYSKSEVSNLAYAGYRSGWFAACLSVNISWICLKNRNTVIAVAEEPSTVKKSVNLVEFIGNEIERGSFQRKNNSSKKKVPKRVKLPLF